ncbi:hypothetical protein [Microbulbifer variabilis]|uniref:hypothetical protein n=1 Tax=Microbulbifer variabilis TaxID=266805 RepID=UPI001CFF125D|nr:hypothetical protein [Microbulbifer variabilis]
MEVNVKIDTSAFDHASAELQRQLPYAGSVALNNVAFRIRGEERSAMGRVFVNPVKLTLNSVLIDKATKRSGRAKVYIRDHATKGTPPSKYLAPAVLGIDRNVKRFERALRYAGLLPEGMYAVHGEGAKLNKHGNISGGTYTKILSQVRASRDPTQNATNSKRSKAKRGITKGYFVGKIEGTLGVWQRVGYKRRRSVRPILIFVKKKPDYRKRFPFFRIAEGIARKYIPIELEKAMDRALATAKRR